jgi:putative SOS response-associated peptidase YedK
MLKPYPKEDLTVYAVNRLVNNAKIDQQEMILPFQEK